ncbi:hypothetical protein Vadar_006574 [Vaccinium darrowii]|uniref:Uncharacterized protein n=1 Tax=Vaccinium darrowii TaxID=229202 RepID=A0ACB7X8M1_9ERIC|nr:hypothetical protein Vadar_006574 [Vaccinium darrowii]
MEPRNENRQEGTSQATTGESDTERVLATMARFSEHQAAFMQWQTQQASAAVSGTGLLERFKKLFPAEFEGSINPVDAENWLKGVERVFVAMGVTDEQRVTLATFNLKGEALIWWEAIQRQLTAPLPDTDEKKCRRFKAGLERNVRTRLTSYKQANYADLVDMARKVGRDVEQMLDKREQSKKSKMEAGQASQASKSGGYYKSGSRFQHLKGQGDFKQPSGQGQVASKPSMGRGGSSGGRGTSFQCYRCGSPKHGIRDCPEAGKGVKCYNCGETGHISKQCLKPRASATSSAGSTPMGRGATSNTPVGRGGGAGGSTAPGRVYAMTRQQVQASPEVVTGILVVSGMHA